MYFLLVYGSTYKLYYSLSRLCRENDLDPKDHKKENLPLKTPKGFIYGLEPDTRA